LDFGGERTLDILRGESFVPGRTWVGDCGNARDENLALAEVLSGAV
jgi:hypothetical protein